MKRQKLLVFVLLLGILLTACTPIVPGSGKSTPSAAAPAVSPTTAVTPGPTGTQAAGQGQTPSTAAVEAAQKALALQLGVPSEQVKVVKSEAVEWPNGCMGVQTPGRMCTMMVTPGYRIILDVSGKQYEFHTNQSGSAVVQAVEQLPQTADKVVVWEQTENNVCSRVEIGPKGVAFGTCGANLKAATLEQGRAEQLSYLVRTYSSFSGATKSGTVQFSGQGQHKPDEAEMRSVAEWAKLVLMEAQGGRGGAAWGSAMAWHREGGIAGFCDDLAVYLNGWAVPTSCKSGQAKANSQYHLTAAELAQMYAWVDQYKNFEYGSKDPAAADAMKITLIFTGTGSQQPSADQQAQIAQFAAQIYTEAVK